MITIDKYDRQHWDAVWAIVEPVFRAMQYNLVVSTNESAVHLWKKQGFAIVGTLPAAFRHKQLGCVDAYVMYKQLES
jgi:hypothetical protein